MALLYTKIRVFGERKKGIYDFGRGMVRKWD